MSADLLMAMQSDWSSRRGTDTATVNDVVDPLRTHLLSTPNVACAVAVKPNIRSTIGSSLHPEAKRINPR